MAIISIPTSIGGVSIPGTTTKGPLGALFDSKYKLGSLQYPRDLGSSTKAHVIKFSINEIQPTGYEENKEYKLPSITEPQDLWNSIKKLAGGETKVNQSLRPKKKRIVSTISLYMPDTVNFQYNSGYSNLSLMDVAKEAAGAVSSTGVPIISQIGKAASLGISLAESQTAKLALSTQGLAINPQQQLLFDGIDFRSYQLAFTFTPYSQQEAADVNRIIKMFRAHAAPQIVSGGGGMFFVPPSTFNLQFILNGKENTNITRVAESVIESIDVNYAPNGWATHPDGAPVQTTLTMQFKEIELIDRKKVEQGY
jgi:hypothetical protein